MIQQISKQENPTEIDEEWDQLFIRPKSLVTYEKSKIFVTQLSAIAFSNVLYIRGVFPSKAYDTVNFGGRDIVRLNGSTACQNSFLMTTWFKSAFDALNKKYMKDLILEIRSEDNDDLLEFYVAHYKYNEDGPIMTFSGNLDKEVKIKQENDLKTNTKNLINSLLETTKEFGALPPKYFISLRINYYEDVTPDDYLPKFFTRDSYVSHEKMFNVKVFVCGDVSTPHHALSVECCSKLLNEEALQRLNLRHDQIASGTFSTPDPKELEPSPHRVFIKQEIMSQDETIEVHQPEKRSPESYETKKKRWKSKDISVKENQPPNEDPEVITVTDTPKSDDTPNLLDDQANEKVSCLCENLSTIDIFTCNKCKTWHHLICYGHLPGTGNIVNKICQQCSIENTTLVCTDPRLVKEQSRAKGLALYRQALHALRSQEQIKWNEFVSQITAIDAWQPKLYNYLTGGKLLKPSARAPGVLKVNRKEVNEAFSSLMYDA